MIVRAKDGRNVQVRSRLGLNADGVPMVLRRQGTLNYAGAGPRSTDQDGALALPAILFCIRLLSETAGMLRPEVCRRDAKGHVTVASETRQAKLLTQRPNPHTTPSRLVGGTVASLQGFGNSIWIKVRDENEDVIELYPMADGMVTVEEPEHYGLPPRYKNRGKTVDAKDVIHFAGWNWGGRAVGRSPLQICMDSVNLGLTAQELGTRYMANNGQLGGILSGPDNLNDEQMDHMRDVVLPALKGPDAAGNIGLISGGWKFERLGVDLASAQWAEASGLTDRQVAKMFRVPYSLMDPSSSHWTSTEQEAQHFLSYSLGPILKDFAETLHLQEDLFGGTDLFVRFDTSALLAVDFQSLVVSLHAGVQSGIFTGNEARERVGLPWHKEGDQLQVVPVGGMANPLIKPAVK